MPRPVPREVAERRRARLRELLDALGAARGSKVTQRDFAASISREQGTVAAILGGHRSLGGDVMLAIVQAYGLPSDYFDGALRPDPRPYARAAVGRVAPANNPAPAVALAPAPAPVEVPYGSSDPALASTLAALRPDRAVAMALEALSLRVGPLEHDDWARHAIAAQSAHDRGALVSWYDATLAERAARPAPRALTSVPTGGALTRKGPRSSKPDGVP